MARSNEVYAYFSLHGDFDPDVISSSLGVPPTESWRQGDRTPNGSHVRETSRWSLHSTVSRSEPLEKHVRNVLDQMETNTAAFQVTAARYGGTMQLVGYFWDGYPGLNFDKNVVLALAKFGLSVDFDFYGLYSHRREDTGFTREGP